jgi:type VI secretion system protein ImpI
VARVLVIEHESTGERRRIAGGRLVIGRGRGCDWTLAETGEASLSRRHCLLEGDGERFLLRDLGSTNGTRRNGVVVPPESPVGLADGDLLELGRHRLRLTLEEAGSAPAPPAAAPAASLDAILAGLAGGPAAPGPEVSGPGAAAPFAGPAATVDPGAGLEADPLGGFVEELEARPARPLAPRAEGPSRGDHAQPQHASFALARPAPPAEPGPGADAAAALRAFLDGAGLAGEELGAGDPERVLREAGVAFAAMAEGLRTLLATRALVKGHAGLERTLIGAAANNPLKYARSRPGAVRALLAPPEPGDLPALAAIEAAVHDLEAHEMGLLEAVEAALRGLLERLDPGVLEERLADTPALRLVLEGGRRARLWELYRERWAELSEQARRRFMGDLDDAFRAAYERRLAAARPARESEP